MKKITLILTLLLTVSLIHGQGKSLKFNKNFVFNTDADFNAVEFTDNSGTLIKDYEDHTWEMWVKGSAATEGIIYTEGVSVSSWRAQYRVLAEAGKIKLNYRNWEAELFNVTGSLTVFDDTWHHIAIVEDTEAGVTTVTLYVDGVVDGGAALGSYTRPTTWVNNTNGSGGNVNRSVFGAFARVFDMDQDNGSAFRFDALAYNGEIDEFASWKKALSAGEVASRADINTGRCTAPTGTDLYRYVSFDVTPIVDSPGSISVAIYDGTNYDGTDGQNLVAADYTNFTFNDYTCPTASVADNILSRGISIFPNPTNNILNINKQDATINIKNISLIDVTGKVVYTKNSTAPINVSQYAKGLYLLKIESEAGGVATRKVVVN